MTRTLVFLSILLSNLFLGAAFLLQQSWGGALACLLLAAIWLVFSQRRITWITSACFIIQAGLSAFCLLADAAPVLPFLSFWVGLSAWDLSGFSARLTSLVPDTAAARLERLHLTRLAYTLAIGLVLGLAGLLIRFQLGFVPAFVLVVLAFIALAFAIRGLIKKDSGQS